MVAGKKCELCGYEFDESNIEESIEEHLRSKHFISYQEYYEIVSLEEPHDNCWKCGSYRYVLSPYLDSIHIACPCCVNPSKKAIKEEIRKDLTRRLAEFQNTLLKNKYYQYILSITPQERQRLLPKSISVISETLGNLKKRDGVRFDRSHVISVENILGSSPEISDRNLQNLKMVPEDFKVTKEEDGRWRLSGTGYYIVLPEIVTFDYRHHSRHSILNPMAKRTSKRLKLESGDCIKFYSTSNPTVKGILKLETEDRKSVCIQDLSENLQWKIRFSVLKTREILERVLEIYNEMFQYLLWISDSVFILNSADLPFPYNEVGLILTWTPDEQSFEAPDSGTIKLSILC